MSDLNNVVVDIATKVAHGYSSQLDADALFKLGANVIANSSEWHYSNTVDQDIIVAKYLNYKLQESTGTQIMPYFNGCKDELYDLVITVDRNWLTYGERFSGAITTELVLELADDIVHPW